MEQQAFSEGIAPGGLRAQNEIKLLVCYLLKSLDRPLSRVQINEILQEYPIANYFEVNQAISDLVKSGNLCTHFCPKLGIQVRQGLIQEENFRITHHGTS